MSTFSGYLPEFPQIRIDQFSPLENKPAPLATFLSHIHTDHLRGLISYKSPFIYCTHATRQLLLRLERYPHRLNFAKGVLESRVQSYRHLAKLLRPLPLDTPTKIELCPGKEIRVTALDANHCPGSCMFLIEGGGKAVLYTGDVRCEDWWVEGLRRKPGMVPYASGLRSLDCVYLDTTFGAARKEFKVFPSKAEGLRELLTKVKECEDGTVFYFHAFTFGYEEALVALASFLESKVHLDHYRFKLYRSLAEGEGKDIRESAPLIGFQEGNRWHHGCFTRDDGEEVKIHSCERGMGCDVLKDRNVIQIIPLVTRHNGIEYSEMGMGGGQGDLDQVHELEVLDIAALGKLMELCHAQLVGRPEVLQKVMSWLASSVKQGAQNIKLDMEAFHDALDDGDGLGDLADVPIDRLVAALENLVSEKTAKKPDPVKTITFPYSRHASYGELRSLVEALRPRSVYPNTYVEGMNMENLFGDLLHTEGIAARSGSSPKEAGSKAPLEDEVAILQRQEESNATMPVPVERLAASSPVTPSPLPDKQIETNSDLSKSKKRDRSSKDEARQSLRRRRDAYRAALASSEGMWSSSVDLISVNGHHNEEKEVEL